jgi:hypothetical protein
MVPVGGGVTICGRWKRLIGMVADGAMICEGPMVKIAPAS